MSQTYSPWVWDPVEKNHYCYLLNEKGERLGELWAGPPAASTESEKQREPQRSAKYSRQPSTHPHAGSKYNLVTASSSKQPATTTGDEEEDDDDDDDEDDEDDDDEDEDEDNEYGYGADEDHEDQYGVEAAARGRPRIDSGIATATSQMQSLNLSKGKSTAGHQTQFTNLHGGLAPSAYAHAQPQSTASETAPVSFQTIIAKENHPYSHYPRPAASRSTVASLPKDVRAHIGNKERRYLQTSADPNVAETLDHRFRRVVQSHHKAFFVLGRVFKMLWTEPAGQANPGRTRNSTHFSLVWLNETAYSEIRYFVVVRNKGTFSQCIPIQTYGRKGATKHGLNMDDHGIIHTTPVAPLPLFGEHLTKYSIRVDANQGEVLDPHSRVNYGKAYAVEHNVKVLDIGMVTENHRYMIAAYYDQAMRA